MNPQDSLYAREQIRLSTAAGAAVLASLEAANPFSLLLAEDDEQSQTALASVLDTLTGPQTRFARATNPLRAALTLERLLIQLVPKGMDALEDPAPLIIRHIAERRSEETRVILVIERAETLDPKALEFLAQTAPYFQQAAPVLQVLFVGRPEFQELLDDLDLAPDEQAVLLGQYRGEPNAAPVPAETPAAPEPPPTAAPTAAPTQDMGLIAQFVALWRRSVLNRLLIVLGPLLVLAALTFGVLTAIHAVPEPVQPDPVSSLAVMPTTPTSAPPTSAPPTSAR